MRSHPWRIQMHWTRVEFWFRLAKWPRQYSSFQSWQSVRKDFKWRMPVVKLNIKRSITAKLLDLLSDLCLTPDSIQRLYSKWPRLKWSKVGHFGWLANFFFELFFIIEILSEMPFRHKPRQALSSFEKKWMESSSGTFDWVMPTQDFSTAVLVSSLQWCWNAEWFQKQNKLLGPKKLFGSSLSFFVEVTEMPSEGSEKKYAQDSFRYFLFFLMLFF